MTEDSEVKGGAVPVHLASMNFEYEGHFIAPSFDMTTSRPELLKALHKEFRPLYSFDAADVQVSDGSRLSDGRISIRLFDGNATIEVTAEELRMVFNNLPEWNFLSHLCHKCITSATRAIVGHHAGIDDGHGCHRRNSPLEHWQLGARSTPVESNRPGRFIRFLRLGRCFTIS